MIFEMHLWQLVVIVLGSIYGGFFMSAWFCTKRMRDLEQRARDFERLYKMVRDSTGIEGTQGEP